MEDPLISSLDSSRRSGQGRTGSIHAPLGSLTATPVIQYPTRAISPFTPIQIQPPSARSSVKSARSHTGSASLQAAYPESPSGNQSLLWHPNNSRRASPSPMRIAGFQEKVGLPNDAAMKEYQLALAREQSSARENWQEDHLLLSTPSVKAADELCTLQDKVEEGDVLTELQPPHVTVRSAKASYPRRSLPAYMPSTSSPHGPSRKESEGSIATVTTRISRQHSQDSMASGITVVTGKPPESSTGRSSICEGQYLSSRATQADSLLGTNESILEDEERAHDEVQVCTVQDQVICSLKDEITELKKQMKELDNQVQISRMSSSQTQMHLSRMSSAYEQAELCRMSSEQLPPSRTSSVPRERVEIRTLQDDVESDPGVTDAQPPVVRVTSSAPIFQRHTLPSRMPSGHYFLESPGNAASRQSSKGSCGSGSARAKGYARGFGTDGQDIVARQIFQEDRGRPTSRQTSKGSCNYESARCTSCSSDLDVVAEDQLYESPCLTPWPPTGSYAHEPNANFGAVAVDMISGQIFAESPSPTSWQGSQRSCNNDSASAFEGDTRDLGAVAADMISGQIIPESPTPTSLYGSQESCHFESVRAIEEVEEDTYDPDAVAVDQISGQIFVETPRCSTTLQSSQSNCSHETVKATYEDVRDLEAMAQDQVSEQLFTEVPKRPPSLQSRQGSCNRESVTSMAGDAHDWDGFAKDPDFETISKELFTESQDSRRMHSISDSIHDSATATEVLSFDLSVSTIADLDQLSREATCADLDQLSRQVVHENSPAAYEKSGKRSRPGKGKGGCDSDSSNVIERQDRESSVARESQSFQSFQKGPRRAASRGGNKGSCNQKSGKAVQGPTCDQGSNDGNLTDEQFIRELLSRSDEFRELLRKCDMDDYIVPWSKLSVEICMGMAQPSITVPSEPRTPMTPVPKHEFHSPALEAMARSAASARHRLALSRSRSPNSASLSGRTPRGNTAWPPQSSSNDKLLAVEKHRQFRARAAAFLEQVALRVREARHQSCMQQATDLTDVPEKRVLKMSELIEELRFVEATQGHARNFSSSEEARSSSAEGSSHIAACNGHDDLSPRSMSRGSKCSL